MKDMNDYICPHSQMEPLLNDYDRHLQRITDLYNQARERDHALLSVEHLYRRPHLTNWENMSEILDVTHELSRVLRQETSVIENMALIPDPERMQFWHEQFLPLEAQEKAFGRDCWWSAENVSGRTVAASFSLVALASQILNGWAAFVRPQSQACSFGAPYYRRFTQNRRVNPFVFVMATAVGAIAGAAYSWDDNFVGFPRPYYRHRTRYPREDAR